jgi:hypothetical protein
MKAAIDRRRFLRRTALGGAGLLILRSSASARSYQANERLNVALIGCGGRGTWFVDTIPKLENVVALCDVNDQKIAETFQRWEKNIERFADSPHDWERKAAEEYRRLLGARPKTFRDFRKMLDAMGGGVDAVVIATPDHTHAVASAAAIKAGKHVFCEKPLTRTVHESRALRELARKHKVATSMGNQGTASGPFRRALELVRDGALGEIEQVHIWNSGGGADRKEPPEGEEPVPEHLDWDLWLGPAAMRPYHPQWMRRNQWRDFGTCQLGNWASHTANLAFMALHVHDLWLADPPAGKPPRVRVEAESSGINRFSFPRWEIVRWEIPARGGLPPIRFNWHNGPAPGARQIIDPLLGSLDDERQKNLTQFAGLLLVGTRGTIHTTGHNATFRLLPEERFEGVDTQRPTTVESSRGHERDWLLACRGETPAWANFDYASALNEFLMLGNVATQVDQKLDFDPIAMRITNSSEADALLRSDYREGWTL